MSSRAAKPDTQADVDLRGCLSEVPPRSFIMKAGAGSGKTTSLIKGLASVISIHGARLRQARQRVACITYTDVAAGEVWKDVGNDSLVHVSTIHSFMWLLAKPFQNDIRSWVSHRISEKIASLQDKQAGYGPRVQQRTKDRDARDIERLERQLTRISSVKSFRYGKGSDYPKGVLGHDDVIKLVPYLIAERTLFRRLLAQQFPFVFVDESQDTTAEIVEALRTIQREGGVPFCVGFFGDPMQRIYATGSGAVVAETGWMDIPKPENFRCSIKVLNLANAIRADGDDLTQVPGERIGPQGVIPTPEGSAHIFVLPANSSKDESLAKVRDWMASRTQDDLWRHESESVKLLVIVHQMAANRLGFGDLYAAMNTKAPDSFKNGFLDGTAWPMAACVKFLIPIALASSAGRELEVMHLLRKHSPLLERGAVVGADVPSRLKEIRRIVEVIASAIAGNSKETIGQLLELVHRAGLFVLDPRLASYVVPVEGSSSVSAAGAAAEEDSEDDGDSEGDEVAKEQSSMDAFLSCPADQLAAYQIYVSERSPFWTQQGIKGAEFDRVLVVLDDEESTHFLFSYEKYLGLKDLSDTDRRRVSAGEESVVDRTRRLFYVCCTRALKDLAVVLFVADPASAASHVRGLGLFESDAVHELGVLG